MDNMVYVYICNMKLINQAVSIGASMQRFFLLDFLLFSDFSLKYEFDCNKFMCQF